jgi:hypothetical protein
VLAVDGDGQPGGDEFQAALGALYSVAYGLHFALQAPRGERAHRRARKWWTPADLLPGAVQPAAAAAGSWLWTLVIQVPVGASDEEVADAISAARRARPSPALSQLHVRTLQAGDCAEILHVGPYSAEGPTIARLHAVIEASGQVACGRHHEVYLGDPRRSDPARLRTLIRQPVTARP